MFRNFKIQVSFYLIGILLLVIGSGYFYFVADNGTYLLVLLPIALIMTVQLFRRIDQTNKEVADFLANIKYDDYAATFSESKALSDSYQNLHKSFNLVTKKFRDIRSEKEAQFQYLQAIVEQVDTGLICFDEEGKTVLLNKGLQQLLHKSYFPNFNSIAKYNEGLHQALNEIEPGERKLVKLLVKDQMVQLSIRKTILQLKEDRLHLYALQNIHAELKEQEVNSWQKLIRILTHEIMNSIAPVVSLSETVNQMMSEEVTLSEEDEKDIRKSLEAIHRRSQGLLNFTQTYRQLTKMPPPNFQETNVKELIERVLTLLKSDLQAQNIEIDLPQTEKVYETQLDPDLMEQVFINLFKNAMDALSSTESPKISIYMFKSLEGVLEIQISDNGPGIPEDIIGEVFVPFYTTKKEGSGIGLSLCRQIIQKHKGSIHVQSKEGKGTVFTIRL